MWQDEAAADWVFHIPPRPSGELLTTSEQADAFARARLLMDTHILDAVASGATRRIVYVADTSCYGAAGSRAITEDRGSAAFPLVRCFAAALDRLDGYVLSGLPIVTALPGWVYGNGSWFRDRVIDPMMSGRRVLTFGRPATRCLRFTCTTVPARWRISPTTASTAAVFPREPRGDPAARVRRKVRGPGGPSVARGESRPWRRGSCRIDARGQRSLGCGLPRTSACAAPAFASNIRRSSSGSRKFSAHSEGRKHGTGVDCMVTNGDGGRHGGSAWRPTR